MTATTLDANAVQGELSVELGYGAEPTHFARNFRGFLNPMGVAFGVSAGVAIHGFYVGASARFFNGETRIADFLAMDPNAPPSSVLGNAVQFGSEIGYGLTLWRFTARLYAWTGATVVSISADRSAGCDPSISGFQGLFAHPCPTFFGNNTRFTVAPGALVRARIVGPMFVGIDGRVSIIFPRPEYPDEQIGTQMTLAGTVGVSL